MGLFKPGSWIPLSATHILNLHHSSTNLPTNFGRKLPTAAISKDPATTVPLTLRFHWRHFYIYLKLKNLSLWGHLLLILILEFYFGFFWLL